MERQRWSKKLLIWEVWNPVCCHGNRTVNRVLKSTFSRILLQSIKHLWYKLAEISLSSYLKKIWLSVWRHHLANLHILKTWISLERKEIFENSKQYFSAHEVYLFMFQNGLDRKDAILVNRPFKWTGKYIRPQKSHEKSHRDQYL